MRVVRVDEMRDIDKRATIEFGIPSIILMENAGRGVCRVIESYLELPDLRVAVISGKGNNGGDGFVVARHLLNRGAEVDVFLLGNKREIKGDARINLTILERSGIEVKEVKNLKDIRDLNLYDLIVDAIFGTGFKGEVKGITKGVIELINNAEALICSIDIPSGVEGGGDVKGEAVMADFTVAMCLPKYGNILYPGRGYCGEVWVADIGIPYQRLEGEGKTFLITSEDIREAFPERPPDGHKGTFGKVLVIAGSRGFTGAASLTSLGALRIGCGLVRLCIPEGLADAMESKLTEIIKIPLPQTERESFSIKGLDRVRELISDSDAIALGPGISVHPETQRFVEEILKEAKIPVVLDADGINNLKENPEILSQVSAPIILTPHPGELSRLIKTPIKEINRDRIGIAQRASREFNSILVLKGAPTVISQPDGLTYINPTGNSGLASGGSGDVLTGMIAGLLAMGVEPIKASMIGVYLHGKSADLAIEKETEYSLIASDLLKYLPDTIKSLEEEEVWEGGVVRV